MAKKKKNDYTNESISALKGADRVRKRPGVMFGSDGIEGCQHSVFEILSNSIDEAREGHGDLIKVRYNKDLSIEIEDFGRGIPVDYNKNEERYNWELVFCELYAGGKYKSGVDYEYSLGLNGLGLCATQYASKYMEAEIRRDGKVYNVYFERGENVSFDSKDTPLKRTGSKIKWLPDLEVFTDIKIPREWFCETLKRQAVVNNSLKFELTYIDSEGEHNEVFFYENGIVDYLNEIAGEETLAMPQFWQAERVGRDREDKEDYKVKLNVAAVFSNKINRIEYYHNSSFLEHGGSPEKAVRSAFISQIDSYLKANNKYLKGESKINFTDIEDCLILVSSSFSTVTSYENQTKKSITNKFITEAMTAFLKHNLEVYFLERPEEAAKIADQVLVNKRSRENAEKTRLNLKKTLSSSMDIQNRVSKFIDCRSKNPQEREIYIVEGDSALGACKLSRDAYFQAIIPVRGKILNCLKAEYDKIFKNDIITDIIKVLGCGVELSGKKNKALQSFNLEALRFSKIVICTDADVDGFQITTLINEGLVYIAESPLYEINTKQKTYFAYDEREKAKILDLIGSEKFIIQRSKGLGENEPDMMWQTTMNPETRRLVRVMPKDKDRDRDTFDMLLGDNLAGRKEYIFENGGKFLDLSDLS